ncbi:hypothetical protein PMAYCL1PPCAC_23920 [Pristionchus mayeri]|uniref:Protein kinase domain-containing protein n=1 Tax=Pristionchus mayeri TaxID=1317129 RepID=A0AAN5D0T1_9BILA|nr:hypothetical protein PMAYCL1PPCAC_23920 [Pristionchus mayeri]
MDSLHDEDGGLTKEEEDELTPLLTQLVREATKSRMDKIRVSVKYRDWDSHPILLTHPATLADFNKQIRINYGNSLSIKADNAKKKTLVDVDSDVLLNKVIQKFTDRGKDPQFILIDKNILEQPSLLRNGSVDHDHCLPGPSRGATVFLPRTVRPLGEGTSAKVELIRCAKTGALFAMKKMLNNDGRKAAREIEAFTTVKSRRLVSLVKAFNEGEYIKLVMDYMPGGSLYSVINEGNKVNESPPISWDLIYKYSREILEGVQDIHMAGYVHMDIKPLNLVIDMDGSLKITDFGSFTKMGSDDYSCELTPMYSSPEALAKNSPCGGGMDIYSVGVTILEMILGRVPWSHVSKNEMDLIVFSTMEKIIRDELRDISPPPPLKEVLEKALVVDPTQRNSASQLLSVLNTHFDVTNRY